MLKIGMIMDPIEKIKPQKDTSFAMLLESQRRGWKNYYIKPQDIWLQQGEAWAKLAAINVKDDTHWFELKETLQQPLNELDILFMRKDPPFNMAYIHLTYLLEQAEARGLRVVNKPSSLRDANEKLFTAWFPQCCPETMVTSNADLIKQFINECQEVIIKPLHGMGGVSIFRVRQNDPNINVIIENMTDNGQQLVMAQQFIPAISEGDKRILMINGEPIPYVLARVPAKGDFRGNLAAGATAEGRELSKHDRWICEQVGPTLRKKGLVFVGLDVIGDHLTEINVTSPTGVRELDKLFGLNICDELMKKVEQLATN